MLAKRLNGIRTIGMLACGLASLCVLFACSESSTPSIPEAPDGTGIFDNLDSVTVDVQSCLIELPKGTDSLVVSSLASLGGTHFYIALDDDPVDPTFDWDNPLDEGSVISLKENSEIRVVALDDAYRVVNIWTISKPKEETVSSSSSEETSSSSSEDEASSSSVEPESSSSEDVSSSSEETSSSSVELTSSSSVVESSSSQIAVSSSSETVSSSSVVESSSSVVVSSSSEVALSSSSVVESSSSETIESSSSEILLSSSSEELVSSSSEIAHGIDVASLTVEGGVVSVSDSKIYVELPYGSDLSKVKFDQLDTANNLIRPLEMTFESDGEEKTFSVVAGVQLPGSDFSKRVDSFWGTTSDAMETTGNGTYKVPLLGFTVDVSVKSDSANVYFANGKMTMITQTVIGHSTGMDGGWKMAGGFYYAGSYSGTDAASIYIADNKDAGADDRPADFSQYMTHGKPFTARPISFEVKYSYVHEKNTNETYPQSSLIYVMLISQDNKVVAAGYLNDSVSVESETKTVNLKYGSDVGLLKTGYPGTAGLTIGEGNEDVASIRVMFASSALAYIADGGTSSQMKKNFRGGENSKLILDNFKFNY